MSLLDYIALHPWWTVVWMWGTIAVSATLGPFVRVTTTTKCDCPKPIDPELH